MLEALLDRLRRRPSAELWLALSIFVALGYFHGGAGWNQNSRLNAIYSFVEPGTPDTLSFRINRFLPAPEKGVNTGDWSRMGDDYYSNKAPGATLLAVPAYAALFYAELLLGIEATRPAVEIANAYLVNLWTSVLLVTAGALALRRMLLAMGQSPHRALLLALIVALCTPLFPYASQLWGHATAASFTILALGAYLRGGPRGLYAAGLCAGAAVLCDYLSAIFALALTLLSIVQHRRRCMPLLTGGLATALVLMIYNAACFGSPFTLSTAVNNPMFQDERLVLGAFSLPSPEIFGQLLFGIRRGIFLQVPVLIMATIGFVYWYRRDRRDGLLWVCAGTVVGFLLANAAFAGWHGGYTVFARYLIPSLPLFCLALKELPQTSKVRYALLASAVLSLCNMLAIAAVNPICSDSSPSPFGMTYQMFFSGKLSTLALPIRLQEFHPQWLEFQQWTVWNLGQLMGLQRAWSLLPLALLALLAWKQRPEELRSWS